VGGWSQCTDAKFCIIVTEFIAGGESFVVVESEDTKFTSKAEEVQRI